MKPWQNLIRLTQGGLGLSLLLASACFSGGGGEGEGACPQVCAHLEASCPQNYNASCVERCEAEKDQAEAASCAPEFTLLLNCCQRVDISPSKCENEGDLGFQDCDDAVDSAGNRMCGAEGDILDQCINPNF